MLFEETQPRSHGKDFVINQDNKNSEYISISGITNQLLEELNYAKVYIPFRSSISVIKQLKKILRTGKDIRLHEFRLPSGDSVKIRSIYDHIISLAKTADIIMPLFKFQEDPLSGSDIAKCIVYHDICEVLLGDIPSHTSETSDISTQRIHAHKILRKNQPVELKKSANNFIKIFLESKEKDNISFIEKKLYSKKTTNLNKFFQLLDKTDPIIAVWQYINHFREINGFDIKNFTKKLSDFFGNPNVKEIVDECAGDRKLKSFFLYLLNMQSATEFYLDKEKLRENIHKFKLPDSFEEIILNSTPFSLI